MTDYDLTDLPAAYDRARDHGPEVLDLWMNATAAQLTSQSITRILDLGCGTGRFSEALAARFNAEVIGLDPSTKMLELAREKRLDTRVQYQLGRAESIPLPAESVDLIFISMSLHHFTDTPAAARECRRILRKNGSVVVRTGTREQIPSYPYVPFFEQSRPILEQTLPSGADVRAMFTAADLRLIAELTIRQTIAPSWSVYAEKLAAGGDSVLARLSRQDFDQGLKSVRRYAIADCHEPVIEPIDFFVFSVGVKQSYSTQET
jgi:ubiquinone/menaquinone biosynthesis C-methylase UbiE